MAGKARQTSVETPAIMSFLRAVASTALANRGSSNALTAVRLMIEIPGKACVSSEATCATATRDRHRVVEKIPLHRNRERGAGLFQWMVAKKPTHNLVRLSGDKRTSLWSDLSPTPLHFRGGGCCAVETVGPSDREVQICDYAGPLRHGETFGSG